MTSEFEGKLAIAARLARTRRRRMIQTIDLSQHPSLLIFEAQAENISPDSVLEEIIGDVKEKATDAANLPDTEKVMRKS